MVIPGTKSFESVIKEQISKFYQTLDIETNLQSTFFEPVKLNPNFSKLT